MSSRATLKRSVSASVSRRLASISQISSGGEGTRLLLDERDKEGFLCFRNSYWKVSLFSIRGRAVPWLPLIIYLAYTCAVCAINMLFIPGPPDNPPEDKLKQLSSVTTTIGVALFLLLSFRNNAAFQRWQTGTDRFKNFCHIGKNIARLITNTLSSYIAVGGREVAYDLVLEKLNWVLVALEIGRQHLRGEKNEDHLLALINPEQIAMLHADVDPVLYCIYKVLDMDRKYFVQKCNEWMRSCDMMYMEFCACMNVYTTPIPFAYISHLRTFLVLWMACVPWVYVITYQWYTVLLCAVIGYGIIGVEEAAVEVEQPFGRDFNDIPLDSIVADTYAAIGTYVKIVQKAKREDQLEHGDDARPADKGDKGEKDGKDGKDGKEVKFKDEKAEKEKEKEKEKELRSGNPHAHADAPGTMHMSAGDDMA